MDIKAVGFHLLLERYDHQEKEGVLITQAIPKYKVASVGKDAELAFSTSAIDKDVYIKPGSEGDPVRKDGRYFYFVHIDYILGIE